jgi:hypothetical protein
MQHGDALQERVEKLEIAVEELRRTVHHLDQALVERGPDSEQGGQPQEPYVQPMLTDTSAHPLLEPAIGAPSVLT